MIGNMPTALEDTKRMIANAQSRANRYGLVTIVSLTILPASVALAATKVLLPITALIAIIAFASALSGLYFMQQAYSEFPHLYRERDKDLEPLYRSNPKKFEFLMGFSVR